MTSDKPTALWSLYFNQAIPDSTCFTDLPSNVHALLLPGNTLGFGEALQQVLSNQNNQNRPFMPGGTPQGGSAQKGVAFSGLRCMTR